MKKVICPRIVVTAILMVVALMQTAFGKPMLTPAQIAAMQAEEQEVIAMIMPPTNVPVTVSRPKSAKAGLASASPMDDPTQPGGGLQQSPPVYAVIDLGVLGGDESDANAINDNGQVVGSVDIAGNSYAFLYSNGSMQNLGVSGSAYGINNNGQIVGGSFSQYSQGNAFLYSNGSVQNLGTLSGGNSSAAEGINNGGQIVGTSATNGYIDNAFLYSNGSMQDLGTLGGNASGASGINDSGQIAGSSVTTNNVDTHAFLYASGAMQDIGTFGGNDSEAAAINNKGQVVGGATDSNSEMHPFLYASGQIQNLDPNGASGAARGINNGGQIVGWTIVDSYYHACLYFNGTKYDLNDLVVDTNGGWTLLEAAAINDSGQIVGYGINPSGQIHAFLLTPYDNLSFVAFHQSDSVSSGVPTYFGYPNAEGPNDNPDFFSADGRAETVHYGCALCSLASMLTSIPGLESMTPEQLDADLTGQTGANEGYGDGDLMNWPAVGHAIGYSFGGPVDSVQITDPSVLETYLENHCYGNRYRVILQFNAIGNGVSGDHFVLVVGRSANDWILFDPGWIHAYVNGQVDDAVLSSLAGHYAGFSTYSKSGGTETSWQFEIKGVRTYELGASAANNISEAAQCPVELLVTDPNGNQVGYNPATGTNVIGILGASYIKDYQISDSDQGGLSTGDTNGVKTVCIPSPIGGTYSTLVIGIGSGSYTLDSSVTWPGNSEITQTLSGITDVGILNTNALFVITPPIITAGAASEGVFNLSFTAQSNVTYEVDGADSPLSTNWSPLASLMATGSIMRACLPMTESTMFYRVRSQ